MIYLRRRLISWLIIAYIKKWRKLIFLFFGIGLLVFFISRWAVSELMTSIRISNVEIIGMVGSYSVDDLPNSILYKISKGLTAVQIDGTVKGDVASSWKIEDGGKKYTFYLKEDIYFTNGKNLTSEDVKYNFADVSVERPDKYSIVYLLKDSYSPFLITLSKPIFTKGLVGVSDHKVKDLKLNGDFVEHINLESKQGDIIIYQFYPTDSSLKMAYGLGEVTKIVDLSDVKFRDTSFNDFENSKIEKRVNYRRQVTLFYNTKDSTVSSKRLRDAFSYTIPDNFEEGERSFGPFPYFSFASQNIVEERRQDLVHAKELLDSAREEGEISENMSIEIKVLLKNIYDKKIEQLKNRNLLFEPANKITLLKLQSRLASQVTPGNFNAMIGMSLCAQAIKISHAIELLETQTISGLRGYLKNLEKQAEEKKSKGVQTLVNSPEFKAAIISINSLIENKIEHPKVEELKTLIENEFKNKENSKIIVFAQFRETINIIVKKLNEINGVNANIFVGQAKKSGPTGMTGMSQKEQGQVLKDFKEGKVNVLCASSVGEEGIDVPEVNAVYFYEPIPSEIRKIQRAGRTARLKPGKLAILITKGTRDEIYYYVSIAKEKKMRRTIETVKENLQNKNKNLNNFK